jgi:hypothetical protein
MTHYTSCAKCNNITLHEVGAMNAQGRKTQICTRCNNESFKKSISERALEEERRAERYKDKTYQDAVDSALKGQDSQ